MLRVMLVLLPCYYWNYSSYDRHCDHGNGHCVEDATGNDDNTKHIGSTHNDQDNDDYDMNAYTEGNVNSDGNDGNDITDTTENNGGNSYNSDANDNNGRVANDDSNDNTGDDDNTDNSTGIDANAISHSSSL